MSDYKRLTKSYKGVPLHTDIEVTDGDEIYERLAELEDKIERGTLIDLPCKVGDTLYAIGKKKVGQIRKCIVGDIRIADSTVEVHFDCDYSCDDCHFNGWAQDYSGEWTCYGEYGDGSIPFSEFGKTVFLTREEAAKRLKELQNG